MANRRGGGGGGNRNKLVVPGAEMAVQNFKNEIAAELGIPNYDQIDKGALPSRVNGMIGGTMVKRMIEMAQQQMAGLDNTVSQINPQKPVRDAMQDLANAAPTTAAVEQSLTNIATATPTQLQ